MIIAAVGKNATGKDYFLEYLSSKYNITMFSIGDIARELAVKDGLEPTRENLHITSEKYMTKYGQTFFPEQVIKKIHNAKLENVLISGIRPLSDVLTLKKEFGKEFILVDVVVSDDNVRFARMKARGSARDPMTMDKFRAYDANEEKLFNTSETEKLADYVLYNDGTQQDFHNAIDNFYNKVINHD